MEIKTTTISKDTRKEGKILLMLLPFWTPSIPPLGISLMKALLQENGFKVKTHDANMDFEFREIYEQYFSIIRAVIPAYKQGNFFNIGMDVMRNQMMAHINYTEVDKYRNLIKKIIYQHYFCDIEEEKIDGLIDVLDRYYIILRDFIHNYIKDYDPQLIGLSVFSGNLASSIFCFREIKKVNPKIETIMGGGTFSMEMAKDNPNFARFLKKEGRNVDKIFIGEGDLLFLRYLEGELDPLQKIYQLSDLSEKNLTVDEIPVPDFADLNMDMYPQIGYWTSRSCPYQCSFCSETIYWGRYRKKEASKMVQDLEVLGKRYKSQVFMMGDSLLNPVIDKLATEVIARKAKVYYDGYLRTDPPVTKLENTMRWRRGGYYRARLGVESGSPNILMIMNKKISVEQIKDSLVALATAGIKTTTYWIAGHPHETEEDFQMTLDILEEMADYIWEAEVNPFSYYLTGQVSSDKWMAEYERVTIFPEEYTNMLQVQTWEMKGCEPRREIIYERVNRFVAQCYKLGIPNPYSEKEIFDADMRWKRLHKNAVPALVEFKGQNHIIDDFDTVIDLGGSGAEEVEFAF